MSQAPRLKAPVVNGNRGAGLLPGPPPAIQSLETGQGAGPTRRTNEEERSAGSESRGPVGARAGLSDRPGAGPVRRAEEELRGARSSPRRG